MLATLVFAGVGEYFDHLFTRIYAPRLEDIKTESHDPIIFDLLRIFLFTGLKETFEALDQVYMGKETSVLINVTLSSRRRTAGGKMLMMLITRGNHELSWKPWRPKQDRRHRTTPLSPTNFDLPYDRESKHTLHDVGNGQ